MTELYDRYFDWMCKIIDYHDETRTYSDLLYLLHDVPFTYVLSMDANRLEDGLNLRYRFGKTMGYKKKTIDRYFNNIRCSILEMMVALAIRLEEHIMDDPEIGDRTNQWFWTMIRSLGLEDMDDENFDETYSYEVICRFLDHDYESNGTGGLFTIEKCPEDLRGVEIWYQACWYLNKFC